MADGTTRVKELETSLRMLSNRSDLHQGLWLGPIIGPV